jgi:hypothetical protein
MSNTEKVEYFNALVGVVEIYRGLYGQETGLIRAQLLVQGVAEANLPNLLQLPTTRPISTRVLIGRVVGSCSKSNFFWT